MGIMRQSADAKSERGRGYALIRSKGAGWLVDHAARFILRETVPESHQLGVRTLVERFDIEPFPDFSAKWANFTGLVLFCIDAKFWK